MNKNRNISIGIREDSPCVGCPERFLACSDKCPRDERGEFGYKAWKAMFHEVNAKRKAYNNLNRRRKWQRTIS